MDLAALSAVELAKLLDVSEKTVRNWMNKNGLPFVEAGRGRTVEWRKAHVWWLAQRDSESGNRGISASDRDASSELREVETYEDALARKTRAEADLKELQLAKERGEVADIRLVTRVVGASVKVTQTQILAVPSRLATRMLGLSDHGRAVSIIEAEMRQLLSNLSSIDAVKEAQRDELKGDARGE